MTESSQQRFDRAELRADIDAALARAERTAAARGFVQRQVAALPPRLKPSTAQEGDLLHRLLGAFVVTEDESDPRWLDHRWPAVFGEWQLEQRPLSVARMPTALVIGEGAVAPFFGKAVAVPSGGITADLKTSLRRVRFCRRGAQLDWLVPNDVELRNPTSDEAIRLLAQTLSNREWRLFAAALVAANIDQEDGMVDGGFGFYFSQRRFADLLGLADRDSARKLETSLRALMSVSFEATVKVAKKEIKWTAEQLILDGRGEVKMLRAPSTPSPRRGPGRPRARLYFVHPHLRILLKGGSWFPLTREMLRPPVGVDARRWDDCFKLETVLAALVRNGWRRASSPGLVWRNRLDVLLDASGIAVPSMRPFEKRERVEELLGVLASTRRLVFELEDDSVRFDMPHLRPALARIARSGRR